MARLQGLLKRTSKAEELELEEARQGSVARLERLLAQRAGLVFDDDEAPMDADDASEAGDEAQPEASVPLERAVVAAGPGAGPDAVDSLEDGVEAGATTAALHGVPVMDPDAIDVTRRRAVHRQPEVLVVADDWDDSAPGVEVLEDGSEIALDQGVGAAEERDGGTPPSVAADGAAAESPKRSRAARVAPSGRSGKSGTGKSATSAQAEGPKEPVLAKAPAIPPPPPRVRSGSALPAHPKRAARQPRQPAVLAACPSCAVLLDPRPTASRRCAQCRERIVVKRLEGGVLYLTAPAAAALEAAQRRVKETARLARTRDRWLAQAAGVGAPSVRIERIIDAVATDEQVLAARDLYLRSAATAFTAARREHRFADAGAIGRAHAQALYKDLGTPDPAPDNVVAIHRDAMTADLRAQRAFGRDAELVAAPCCDACSGDAGLIARISDEVKVARLPHAGCPTGLCRCRWAPSRVAGRRPSSKVGSDR